MAEIKSQYIRCYKRIATNASLAAATYYKIKDLKKEIKKLKLNLAKYAQGLAYSEEYQAIYPSDGDEESCATMTGIPLKSPTFKRDTCTRFLKHLKNGDLVKTAEQAN